MLLQRLSVVNIFRMKRNTMKTRTNLFQYLLNDFSFAFCPLPLLVFLLSPFCKNNSRYPDKKKLKELLKILNPFVVSYLYSHRKKRN
jgi:hypothetical protein